MADKNIGTLPQIPQLDDESLLVVEQQGQAGKMTGAQFKAFGVQAVQPYAESAVSAASSARSDRKYVERVAGTFPVIGENGNWMIDGMDTGQPARGPMGSVGPMGPQGEQGVKGVKGETGPQGATGPQGIQGPKGENGPQGPTGPQGPVGPKGEIGPSGKDGTPLNWRGEYDPLDVYWPNDCVSYNGSSWITQYEIPEYSYPGEAREWELMASKGQKGNTGSQGPRGLQGETGPQGPQGIPGLEGPRGINGVAVSTTGAYAFNVDENGHLILNYTGTDEPDFSIGADGHLYLDI